MTRSNLDRTPILIGALAALALAGGCSGSSSEEDEGVITAASSESCMKCHNGSDFDDYNGGGLENPHPFTGAGTIKCTGCHGGNPGSMDPLTAHVPPPPQVGDRTFQTQNATAYFNRLTLAGMDKVPDYVVNGVTYTSLQYLKFVNPGDLRVVGIGEGCGACHAPHADAQTKSLLFTETGIFGNSRFMSGSPNVVNPGLYGETANDWGWRAADDPFFPNGEPGSVGQLIEAPVFSVRGQTGGANIFNNTTTYLAASLNGPANQDPTTFQVVPNSPLANLFHEQVAFTCGDCHLGSAGANNRYGDYRSSGCTACHMRYSLSGRYTGPDMNLNRLEPIDTDDIDDPERAHTERHLIRNVAKTLTDGRFVPGIDDYSCVDCHQGSNRTVLQYWGIRLDQNANLVRRVQYPANPDDFETTRFDTRLYDPAIANQTFNGRNFNQYILEEDYDGDNRDDTPPDVHYDAGLGCIDCHGSQDIHGGRVGIPDLPVLSHMEQAVGVKCESCHGTISAYAATVTGTAFDGTPRTLAVDRKGTPLTNVYQAAPGEFFLISKLTGRTHYVPQTRDTVADNGKRNPLTGERIYTPKASYAMGRVDGDASNGQGPVQGAGANFPNPTANFSHTDNMDCVSCHAAWTNTCTGCHLKGQYDNGNNFSNITGQRIVYEQTNADFTYQTVVPFQIGINTHNKVGVITTNTNVFFQYRDINEHFTKVFSFSDRRGAGAMQQPGGSPFPSLTHNLMMPHSIRGRVTADKEGVRQCVSCHLTTTGLANFGTQNYLNFRDAMQNASFTALNYNQLRDHIGLNPGNQINSPLWVHQVVGLGTGLFLFTREGRPVNPLDDDPERFGCQVVTTNADGTQDLDFGPSPRDIFEANPATWTAAVQLNLDRIVEPSGVANGSNNHALLTPIVGPDPFGPNSLRDGALDRDLAGPLGARLIRRLSDPTLGVVLDAWIDADGNLQGAAPSILPPPPPP